MTMMSMGMLILQSWFALYLVAAGLHMAYGLVRRMGAQAPLSAVWALTGLVFLYLATAVFHLLAVTGSFNIRGALSVTVAAQLVFYFFVMPFPQAARGWARDAQTAWRALQGGRRGVVIVAGVAAVLASITVAKTLLIPPLGWDAVSYHMAKAAMWVQSGHLRTLVGPGGWSYFPLFAGGGDLVYAWALLPFRSDLLACAMGGVVWLAGGLAAYALARVLGASRLGSGTAALLILWTPAVHRMAGSGYVEPVLQLYTSLMALCVVLYFEKRQWPFLVLAFAAIGLMMGVKVMGLVLGGVAGCALVLRVIAVHRNDMRHWIALGGGALLASLAVCPWWWQAIKQTGRPLSPLPIRLLGIELGRINPDLQWIQVRSSAIFSLAREWDTLKALFLWNSDTPSLGWAWAFLALILLSVMPRLLRNSSKRAIVVFLLVLIGAFLSAYYHPQMLVLRTYWPTSNARYWIQILPLMAALLSVGCERFRGGRWGWVCVALGITAWHAQREVFWGMSGITLASVPWVVLIFVGALVLIRFMLLRGWLLELTGVLVIAAPVFLVRLAEFRDANRWAIYADEGTKSYHQLLRYWVRAAEFLDQPEEPHRIAVTSAPWQNGDNWLVYPFLGRRFQNQLLYVPISASGEMVPFDGTARYLETSHPAAWVARLYQHGVTHVMSFWPPSVEVYWMLQYPQIFEVITVSRKWGGCFRLKPWEEARRALENAGARDTEAANVSP